MRNHTISSRGIKVLFSFLLLWFSAAVSAIPVDGLYTAEVLVTDESARQLRTGARAGLLQVLVRVSGRLDVEDSSLVRNALRNPSAYYYQYSYEQTDRTLLVDSEMREARLLRVEFEPSAVARLLRDANLPVWGSNRPGVLLWIAASDGQSRRILGESDPGPLVASLSDQAKQRGLPLIFPIMDIEDAARISTAEVWGAFLDRIEAASTRYNPDAVLTGRIQQEFAGRWSGRWSFRIGGDWTSIESTGASADELIRGMIDQLADEMAERYALGSSRGRVTLVVEGVATVTEYAALSAYLEQLTPVLQSSIVALHGDVAEFELETEGQYQQLVDIIELDQRLLLLNGNQRGDRLLFRWKE